MSSTTGQMKPPTTAPDISEACARANDEDSYNGVYLENMRAERMRAADAFDNYQRASILARQRMEACDAALSTIEADQPSGIPMRG